MMTDLTMRVPGPECGKKVGQGSEGRSRGSRGQGCGRLTGGGEGSSLHVQPPSLVARDSTPQAPAYPETAPRASVNIREHVDFRERGGAYGEVPAWRDCRAYGPLQGTFSLA